MRTAILVALASALLATPALGGEKTKTLQAKVVKRTESKVASGTMSADSYSCTNGGHKREVEVKVENPETRVPCAVHYRKVTEQPGHDQVLWSAQNDAGYCSAKAEEFKSKLQSWGWNCSDAQTSLAH